VTEVKENRKHASARATADHLCIDPSTFSKYLNQGVIKRRPRHIGYDLDECRRARFKFLENQAAGRSGEDGGELLSKQRARLATAQAVREEMKTAALCGDLVSLDLIEKVMTPLFYNFREQALSTPGIIADAVASVCGGDRVLIYSIIDDRIREMLTELADGKSVAVSGLRPRRHRGAAANIEEPA
jgi:hypothetical protein